MIKEKTINIIINALKPFKLTLEYLSCEKKDGQANFVFRIKERIKVEKVTIYADDIRMRLACKDSVKIKNISEDTVCVILTEEFAEESIHNVVVTEEQSEANGENSRLDEAIKTIKKELRDGKTSDMLTLMKAMKD